MPPPGDARPARLPSSCATSIWDALYAPLAGGVAFAAERLNRLQFLTIRQLSQPRLRRARRSCSWCSRYGPDPRPRRSRRADAAGAAAGAAAAPASCARSRRGCCAGRARRCIQPYRDLVRLMRKEVVLARERLVAVSRHSLSDLRRHLGGGFAGADLRAPGCCSAGRPISSPSSRCSAARASSWRLPGMDVGTSFGGIGSSREVMIASLAEPAMIMIVFTLALIAGSTQLSTMAAFMVSSAGRPAGVARPGAARADHRRDRRERAHPGRQSGDPSRAHHGA